MCRLGENGLTRKEFSRGRGTMRHRASIKTLCGGEACAPGRQRGLISRRLGCEKDWWLYRALDVGLAGGERDYARKACLDMGSDAPSLEAWVRHEGKRGLMRRRGCGPRAYWAARVARCRRTGLMRRRVGADALLGEKWPVAPPTWRRGGAASTKTS